MAKTINGKDEYDWDRKDRRWDMKEKDQDSKDRRWDMKEKDWDSKEYRWDRREKTGIATASDGRKEEDWDSKWDRKGNGQDSNDER